MAVPATLLLLGVVMSAQVTTIQVSPPQATQPRDPNIKTAVGTGSISGKVIAADTGAPIRRAEVTLGGPQRPHMTYTDNEGQYSFSALPAATYTLTATPTADNDRPVKPPSRLLSSERDSRQSR
jgi:Carboxypeptidase regulatory-like domain